MGEARKNDEGKLRYSLIPPECLEELARVYTIGAEKYGAHNWQKRLEIDRIMDAFMRHFEARRKGEIIDPEDGQLHMAAIAWGAFAIMWYDMRMKAIPKNAEMGNG